MGRTEREHFVRTGHGTGAGKPHVEVPPHDEAPAGVPQVPGQGEGTGERRADGRWAKGARTSQAAGGKAMREATRLARKLGLLQADAHADFAEYLKAAKDFRRAHTSNLSRNVGAGVCGPGPSSIVATSALQLAASRFLFDLAARKPSLKLFAEASRLADASRQSLLAAHSLCALEAKSRPADPRALPPGYDWVDEPEGKP